MLTVLKQLKNKEKEKKKDFSALWIRNADKSWGKLSNIIFGTEIMEYIAWKPMKSSLVSFRDKVAKQSKEQSCCKWFFSISKIMPPQSLIRCGFLWLLLSFWWAGCVHSRELCWVKPNNTLNSNALLLASTWIMSPHHSNQASPQKKRLCYKFYTQSKPEPGFKIIITRGKL